MPKLLVALEQRLGIFWAYILLFMVTWLLIVVVVSFIHVNVIISGYSNTAEQWRDYLPSYLADRAAEVSLDTSLLTENAGQEIDSKETEQGLLGTVVVSGKPTRGLLKMVPHHSFDHLNVLSTSKKISSEVITDLYPVNNLSSLFYNVDISELESSKLDLEASDRHFSYAWLYTEERYFVLLIERFIDRPTVVLYLYNLDGIWTTYVEDKFQKRTMHLERESRFGSVVLKDHKVHYIDKKSLIFDWSEFSIPIRYSSTVPVSWQHLNFINIIWQTSLVTMLLYIFLFFYTRYENKQREYADH